MSKKLSAPQEKLLAELCEYGKPFRVFPPKYMGRFGTTRAHISAAEYESQKDMDFRPAVRWPTYEALVRAGRIVEFGRFSVDATEGARNATGRVARLATPADEVAR